MPRILILEDDTAIREAVAEYLRLADHEVVECGSGDEVLQHLGAQGPDLFVLDVAVPGRSGFSVAKAIRSRSQVPIVFLTARDDETSRITGLELGADDYVTKPFSPRELVLRVNAILRRAGGDGIQTPETAARRYALGGAEDGPVLTVDPERHTVSLDGTPVHLTATEWRLLEVIAARAPGVVARDVLIEDALGYDATVETRSADAHIKNLRAKLGDHRWVETVRGFGYRFGGTATS